jgi:glycogen debranching enzyme
LQALCAYDAFQDFDLAKRCLYLFAGLPFNDQGLLCACVYEKPVSLAGGNSLGTYPLESHLVVTADADAMADKVIFAVDYSMLYAVTLLDYVKASGDLETGRDLFDTAARQFRFYVSNFDEELRYELKIEGVDGLRLVHFVDCEFFFRRRSYTFVSCRGVIGVELILQRGESYRPQGNPS